MALDVAMGNKVFNVPLQTAEPPRYSGSDCSKSTLVLIYLVKNFCFPHDCSKKKKQNNNHLDFLTDAFSLFLTWGGIFFIGDLFSQTFLSSTSILLSATHHTVS